MSGIINLTQHDSTPTQADAGVVEPVDKTRVKALLTFEDNPPDEDVLDRARQLATIAWEQGSKKAMIGGYLPLMGPLEMALRQRGIVPLYAFSRRVSKETTIDGKVVKTADFVHLGFKEGLTHKSLYC